MLWHNQHTTTTYYYQLIINKRKQWRSMYSWGPRLLFECGTRLHVPPSAGPTCREDAWGPRHVVSEPKSSCGWGGAGFGRSLTPYRFGPISTCSPDRFWHPSYFRKVSTLEWFGFKNFNIVVEVEETFFLSKKKVFG